MRPHKFERVTTSYPTSSVLLHIPLRYSPPSFFLNKTIASYNCMITYAGDKCFGLVGPGQCRLEGNTAVDKRGGILRCHHGLNLISVNLEVLC